MAQEFHRFKAESLDEAYNLMRERLGDEAIVVRTAQIKDGGIFGFMGKPMIELTATGPETRGAARKRSAVERRYASASMPKPPVADTPAPAAATAKAAVGSDEAVADSVAYFQQLVSDAQKRLGVRPQSRGPQASAEAVAPIIPFRRPKEESAPDAVRKELRELRELVEVLVAESPGSGVPAECAPLYKRLIDCGTSRKAAAALLAGVVRNSDLDIMRDARVVTQRLAFEVAKQVRVTGGITVTAGTRRIVALVGATGVGKTTNLAKLAAHFAVREHARVALVTADTYRVAAPEQLRVYANIIGIPMHVVNDPAEMQETLRKLREFDLIFVDTAGGSQFNKGQLREMREMLAAASPDETMLVMGANTQLDDLRQIVLNFAPLRPTSLFFSKLDETRRYGSLYTILTEAELPLSYFSVGQNVPEDLVLAKPEMVSGLLLEGKVHHLGSGKTR
ncbi:MAG: flagellar biosynthesis protein FlhF [Candidatus Hydrogenedentes bacterium]|nr:flagellar biosynthesis protein FlhF [Candidatus Hydrogenedentota bacterium]